MRSHVKTSPNLRRQLTGWGGLLLYVLALSPVGLVLLGILGTLDADHRAVLQSDADGIRLVLRHEGGCARHQHHAVARVLTLFAAESSAPHSDHVLQFSAGNGLLRAAQTALTAPRETIATPLHVASGEPSVVIPASPLTVPLYPPPDAVGPRRSLRSTVLLI